ncbi:phenylalanine--tRNA ligase subunit beta [Candidatus Uhrbacteria bacterium]|nr:phenylalanine--tRNA ligase subunit beta [Candidatus Uhrbacteria bacterium]
MNLSVPYSWLKEYVRLSVSAKEVARRMSLAGCTIDRIRVHEGETIFDVEITTNRPDAYALMGFAREVAAVFKKPFRELLSDKEVIKAYAALSKEARLNQKKDKRTPYSLSIAIRNSSFCRRYCGMILDHIKIAPSPLWMQKRLTLAGMRPINNVVDITNYVMLQIGQPMHAFDADRLAGAEKKIIVRTAKSGEVCKTLDGEEKKLSSSMLVIADVKGPLAIAGIKGGNRAGIHAGTHTIVLESANFEPVSIRTTSRTLDLRTDSSARYEKGLSPEYSSRALLYAIELLQQYAHAHIASAVIDVYPKKEKKTSILFDVNEITRITGISIPRATVTRILVSLGFRVSAKGTHLVVEPPFWRRADCTHTHDLVEEIARIYGYTNVSPRFLGGEIPPLEHNPLLRWEQKTKEVLRNRGWVEVMNYSCVGTQLLEKTGTRAEDAVKLHNPLSNEFAYLRKNLLGGLLETISSNEQRAAQLRVFELSKVYVASSPRNLPSESRRLAGAFMSRGQDTDLFRAIKGSVEVLCREWFGARAKEITFRLLENSDSFWGKGNAAILSFRRREIGVCGFPLRAVTDAFGIKTPVVCFDLAFEDIYPFFDDTPVFTPLPKYPSVVRDISFVVSAAVSYQDIEGSIRQQDPLIGKVELFDVFEGARIGAGKRSVALHITYVSSERTLHAEEVDETHARVVAHLEKTYHASIR